MTPDILKKIVTEKWRELESRKQKASEQEMQKLAGQASPTRGFKQRLLSFTGDKRPAVIAEIKKASPSKGIIREDFDPVQIAKSYATANAACLSILTDVSFFQGADAFLSSARDAVDLPVLRKDFTVDAYQVYEARSIGADCILLIVSILDDNTLQTLHDLALSLGMNVLVEVHDEEELQRALKIKPDILGINNRNLRTFDVSLETTFSLMKLVDPSTLLITESGISTKADVDLMLERGIFGFLVGEAFMRHPDPGQRLLEFFPGMVN